jgi:hypothetical protein
MAALRALKENSFFFAGLFSLSGREPFNHQGIALFADHGYLLPQMIPTNRDILAAFPSHSDRTMIKPAVGI